jgi:hypothetical protein
MKIAKLACALLVLAVFLPLPAASIDEEADARRGLKGKGNKKCGAKGMMSKKCPPTRRMMTRTPTTPVVPTQAPRTSASPRGASSRRPPPRARRAAPRRACRRRRSAPRPSIARTLMSQLAQQGARAIVRGALSTPQGTHSATQDRPV